MRTALLFGPADLRVVERDRPEPGPGEVLVRVVSYAPYGTDLSAYLNLGGHYISSYPVGIGADFSGVIAALGPDVEGFAVGDRVTAMTLEHCGVCDYCRRGRTNLCQGLQYTNAGRQTCCAEFTLVKARKLARLPDNVSFDSAAMLAGVIVALNAFEKMSLVPGQLVAVIGVGAMGLCAIGVAKALGCEVVAVGGTGRRADYAETLGARAVVRLGQHGEDVSAASLAHSPSGYSAVLETTTSDWGQQQAFAIAAIEGTVALTGGGALPVGNWDIVRRELKVVGVRAGHHQEQGLDLIARGLLTLEPTITARRPLEQAPEVFALLASDAAKDVGRIIIECSAPPSDRHAAAS
jgi:threonine dehydrogenase-like Zn-dependent dehydrogenase